MEITKGAKQFNDVKRPVVHRPIVYLLPCTLLFKRIPLGTWLSCRLLVMTHDGSISGNDVYTKSSVPLSSTADCEVIIVKLNKWFDNQPTLLVSHCLWLSLIMILCLSPLLQHTQVKKVQKERREPLFLSLLIILRRRKMCFVLQPQKFPLVKCLFKNKCSALEYLLY